MKRVLIVTVVLLLLLAGCSAGGGATKLGLAQSSSIASSADLAENDDGIMVGTAQVDTTVAAVMIDSKGKVVDIKIDTTQTMVRFDEDGVIISDKDAPIKTKRELGNDYGMIKGSSIGREWFEQIDAIEQWMIGKTSAEIANMKLKADDNGGNATDEPDLVSKATLTIDEFIKIAVDAIANAG